MNDVGLKHYRIYIKRLHRFAAAIGVTIQYGDYEDIWVPSRRKIKIDDAVSNGTVLASLLHELGHALDDMVCSQTTEKTDNAYKAFYADKATKKQKSLVLQFEKRGWAYGREIASRLNIRLGKWFDDEEKTAIKSYRS